MIATVNTQNMESLWIAPNHLVFDRVLGVTNPSTFMDEIMKDN